MPFGSKSSESIMIQALLRRKGTRMERTDGQLANRWLEKRERGRKKMSDSPTKVIGRGLRERKKAKRAWGSTGKEEEDLSY